MNINPPAHDDAYGEIGVDALLARAGLDEVRPGHHAGEGGLVHVAHGAKFADGEDRLE